MTSQVQIQKKIFCQVIEGKILCTLAAYFIWVNSNSQLDISFMIYPKNRKRFNFPESSANKQKKFLKVLLFSFSWAPSQFRTTCLTIGFTYIGEQTALVPIFSD